MLSVSTNTRLSFGLYEADLETGELWKAGRKIKLQSQPFKLLATLLERPGQVVTREELQQRLWGPDTVVHFEQSLGTAINKVREALGDSAENPRFIETLSKRGYRFIAPVQAASRAEALPSRKYEAPVLPTNLAEPMEEILVVDQESAKASPGPPARVQLRPVEQGELRPYRRYFGVAGAIFLLSVTVAGAYVLGRASSFVTPPHITQITTSGNIVPGARPMEDLAAIGTDGLRLFTSVLRNGQDHLVAVELASGAQTDVSVPAEIGAPTLSDLSPDASKLLLRSHLSRESEQPLWVVPASGGSAQRVGNVLAHDASWMPDGERILYAAGNDLYVTGLTDTPQRYASLPGRAFWLRWSPNGNVLRFTLIDPIAHTLSLWQLAASDRKPEPLLNGWSQPAQECCGIWTGDGKSFVFQATKDGSTNLWRLEGSAGKSPKRLTDGPLQFESPVGARAGGRIYFLGGDARFAMERYSAATKDMVPEESWLRDCVRIAYSRDSHWVAWTTADGHLWRSRPDGTERIQLTSSGLEVFLAAWSPDSSSLAVMARKPGEAWRIYLVPSEGGPPRLALDDKRNAADPSWGPDGQTLVFGRVDDAMGKEAEARSLLTLDLRSGKVQPVPGSEGLFSPRWSPNGKYIAALSLDGREVRLFNVATQQWSKLPVNSGADPHWSADSGSLWVHEFADPLQPIVQIAIPSTRITTTVNLVSPKHSGSVVDFVFAGVLPSGDVLVQTRTNTGNLYTLDVNQLASNTSQQ